MLKLFIMGWSPDILGATLLLGLAIWALIHIVVIIRYKEYTVKEPRIWLAWLEAGILSGIIVFAGSLIWRGLE